MTDSKTSDMQIALGRLLTLAGMPPVLGEISAEQVSEAVSKLRQTILDAKMSVMAAAEQPPKPPMQKTILIAGELGIIIHQLKQSLTRLGGEVTIINDMFEAIRLFQLHEFRVVILDANMPSHEDDLATLRQIAKRSHIRQLKTDIIVLIQPSKDMSFQVSCKEAGATVVLPKDEGWQSFIGEYLKTIGF